ncbi:hypothetical protein [Paenibacillus beijingensis]|uniref:Uncharacterized protein n=1 Tax=Paenibacillus beijingensis TaxID=1126833 RepID=A0A0D5NLY7_9BACL|nr:hypothetical protein [Paenibacillus beijingensis]AJY75948.1 hypothetical protein VN24_17055 [Paenibacillus beijingensis]
MPRLKPAMLARIEPTRTSVETMIAPAPGLESHGPMSIDVLHSTKDDSFSRIVLLLYPFGKGVKTK